MMALSACTTTTQTVALKPTIDAALRVECAPLPLLDAKVGDDLREAVLRNRVRSEAVHSECSDKLAGVLQAVGAVLIKRGE